jgi:hypothetical protein
MLRTPHQLLFRLSNQEDEMGETCSTRGAQERRIKGFGEETLGREKDHQEDLG